MILKIVTGIFIVPLAITAHHAWPLWTSSSMPARIITSPLVLPLAGLAAVLTPWWNNI